MSNVFIDTNQQKVCKKCGNRWFPVVPDPGCSTCNTANKFGGQILPEEDEDDEKTSKKSKK